MEYASAARTFNTARYPARGKPIANNTRIMARSVAIGIGSRQVAYDVILHNTAILTFYADGAFTVDAGGWHTITTQRRMNEFMPEGYRVWRKGGTMALYRYDPSNPIISTRRRWTYRYEDRVHAGGWVNGAYDPNFETTYKEAVPDGWETYQSEDPYRKLADLSGPVTIDASGTVHLFGDHTDNHFKVPHQKPILAWHRANAYNDRPHMARTGEAILPGQTYRVLGSAELCHNGLHASRKLRDATSYAHGRFICRVALWGDVHEGPDKLCATRRKVLWIVDSYALTGTYADEATVEAAPRWTPTVTTAV